MASSSANLRGPSSSSASASPSWASTCRDAWEARRSTVWPRFSSASPSPPLPRCSGASRLARTTRPCSAARAASPWPIRPCRRRPAGTPGRPDHPVPGGWVRIGLHQLTLQLQALGAAAELAPCDEELLLGAEAGDHRRRMTRHRSLEGKVGQPDAREIAASGDRPGRARLAGGRRSDRLPARLARPRPSLVNAAAHPLTPPWVLP